MFRLLFLVFVLCFTRFYLLTDVPGFHFDEAWQGLYAHRIMSEPDFWPLKAMNGYTSPVVHYILSFIFRVFGPSLFAMRATFVGFHLAAVSIFFFIFWLLKKKPAGLWFLFLVGFLPALIHTSRFAIEMDGFHNLCLSLVCLGIVILERHRVLGFLLTTFGLQLGALSHIIFFPTLLALIFLMIQKRKKIQKIHLQLLVLNLLLFLPLLSVVHFSIRKWSTLLLLFILVLFLQSGLLFLFNEKIWHFFQKLKVIERVSGVFHKVIYALAIPYGFYFLFLLIDGSFAYGQVTGFQGIELPYWLWLPVNLFLLGFIFYKMLKTKAPRSELEKSIFSFMCVLFVFTSLIIFKQTPRYYSNCLLLFCFWLALVLSGLKINKKILNLGIILFSVWNFYAFFNHYILPFQKYGSKDKEFRFLLFKDSSRDFRPYQKVYAWLSEQGCQNTLTIVEDDRFLRPIQFLRLSDKNADHCPWKAEDILFLHIPEDPKKWHQDIALLAHDESWGDLGLWKKR